MLVPDAVPITRPLRRAAVILPVGIRFATGLERVELIGPVKASQSTWKRSADLGSWQFRELHTTTSPFAEVTLTYRGMGFRAVSSNVECWRGASRKADGLSRLAGSNLCPLCPDPFLGLCAAPVGYSNSNVPMVKPTQDWQGEHASYPLGVARNRCVRL